MEKSRHDRNFSISNESFWNTPYRVTVVPRTVTPVRIIIDTPILSRGAKTASREQRKVARASAVRDGLALLSAPRRTLRHIGR